MNLTVSKGKTWLSPETIDYAKLNATATPVVAAIPGPIFYGVDVNTSTVNAFNVSTLTGFPSPIPDGTTVQVRVYNGNTGDSTIVFPGSAAIQILKQGGFPLVQGDLRASSIVTITYSLSAAKWYLQSVFNPGMEHLFGVSILEPSFVDGVNYKLIIPNASPGLANGQQVYMRSHIDSGSAVPKTLHLFNNSGSVGGQKQIKQQGNVNIGSGNIKNGQIVLLQFDSVGDVWQVLSAGSTANSIMFGSSITGNDSYAFTVNPAPSSLTDGLQVWLKTDVANSAACTLNLNGLGAKPIRKSVAYDLKDFELRAGQWVPLIYDTAGNSGTGAWQLQPTLFAPQTQVYSGMTSTNGASLNTYVVATADIPASGLTLLDGTQIWFTAHRSNTTVAANGIVNVNFQGTGDKPVHYNGLAVNVGAIIINRTIGMVYNSFGGNWTVNSFCPEISGRVYSGLVSTTGTPNAYVCTTDTISPTQITAEGTQVWFRSNFTNTATPSFNFQGAGAFPIHHLGSPLGVGAILIGRLYGVNWNSNLSVWQIIGSLPPENTGNLYIYTSAALSTDFNGVGGTMRSFTHGFGSVPLMIRAVYVCVTTDPTTGHTAGDEVSLSMVNYTGAPQELDIFRITSNTTITEISTHLTLTGNMNVFKKTTPYNNVLSNTFFTYFALRVYAWKSI